MKISLAVVGAVLLGGMLVGCGGSDDGISGDYCQDIKSVAPAISSLSGGDLSEIDTIFETLHSLSGEAPGEVKDDWKAVDNALTSAEKALADAGLSISDIATIQRGQIPAGANMSKLAGLATELAKLNNEEFTSALGDIGRHARDVCKVQLEPAG